MMSTESLTVAGIGIAVFASTNVDDVLLLGSFFADERLRPRWIVLGQFLGMAALVSVSAVAGMAAVVVPAAWTAMLGVAPLGLGLWKLRELRRGQDQDGELRTPHHESAPRPYSQVLTVAAVTIANGGDNLGVYIPLFAQRPAAVPLYSTLFAFLTGVCCLLGYLLVNNPLLGRSARRHGRVVLPFVLIGLGLYILAGTGAFLK